VYRPAQDWGYTNYINCIYTGSGTPIAALSGINTNIMTVSWILTVGFYLFEFLCRLLSLNTF